jgi:hypothetical protein
MKTILKLFLLVAFLIGGMFITDASGDPPSDPPPPPDGGHGGGSNQPPEGAPIDGGLGILFILGSAFAGIKIYKSQAGGKEKM